MSKEIPGYLKFIVILLGITLIFYMLSEAGDLLVLLAFACLLSLLLLPFNDLLERWKFPRMAAILLSILLVVIIIALFLLFVYSQIITFADDVDIITERLAAWARANEDLLEKVIGVQKGHAGAYVRENISTFLQKGTQFFSTTLAITTGLLTALGLIPVFVFFMLYYRDFFKTFLLKLFNKEQHPQVHLVIGKVKKVANSYLLGLVIVISIISVLNVTGLTIMGVNHALFFGVFAGILNIIPYIGVFIGSLLPIAYTYIMGGSLLQVLGVAGVLWFIQILESNLITPNVVGGRVSLNPFAAILALIIGGYVWGPAGMILFIPFAAILKVVLDSIDHLQPYGFLLGLPPEPKGKKKNFFGRLFKKNR